MSVELKNISKQIQKNIILDNINLCMEDGKIYGIQGKNGSGKTMLMKLICGLVFPAEGEVLIDGKQLGKNEFPQDVGALIENPAFIEGYSGLENLKILASIKKKVSEEEICQWMLDFGLDPNDKKKAKKYSLGMKQKIGIISAMMERPKLLILDEPMNALDEGSVEVLKEKIEEAREGGALVLISSHDGDELEKIADELIVMKNGKVVECHESEK